MSPLYVLCVLVPTPQLMLSQSRDGEDQLAGSSLTFTIDIAVDDYVDTPHVVFVSWTRNETILASGGRITVSDVSDTNNSNQFQAQLMFSTLSSIADSGMYTSTVSVNGISSYPYVISALPTTQTASINVPGTKSIDVVVLLVYIVYCNMLTQFVY